MTLPTDSSLTHGNGRRWVIMGVCGCGKTTAGAALAARLGVPFLEGDAFHPAPNVAKMSAGIPLTDDDRAGWLRTLAGEIGAARARGEGIVVSCSALKRRYRDLLRQADPGLAFAHLHGTYDTLAARMQTRTGHFMPASLLESQMRDLEPLQSDEAGVTLDLTQPPKTLVASIIASIETTG